MAHRSRPILLITLLLTLGACPESPHREISITPDSAPADDPVERSADAAVRTLLDVETLAATLERSGLERLTAEQRTSYDTWLAEMRAAAPAPPPLRYRLAPDRFDAASRSWPVDVALPSLGEALGAPACRLALVLEPEPGSRGADAPFRIVEARLALR